MKKKQQISALTVEQLERRLLRLKNSREKVDILIELGSKVFVQDKSRAYMLFDNAYTMANNLKYEQGIMLAAHKLATYYADIQKDIVQAQKYTTIAAQLATKQNNIPVLALILRIQGGIHELQEQYKEAETSYLEALALHEQLADKQSIAYTNNALGELYWKTDRYQDAHHVFNKTLEYFRQTKNMVAAAGILHNIAVLYSEQGNYAQSIIINDQSIELKKSVDDIYGLVMSYHTAATQYVHIKDYEKAIQYFLESLELKKKLNVANIFYTLGNMGYVYSMAGQYDLAYQYYQKAYMQANNAGRQSDALDYQIYSASVLAKKGDYQQAAQIYQMLDPEIAEWQNIRTRILYLQNKAGLYLKQEMPAQAQELLLQANALLGDNPWHTLRIQVLFGLAEINLRMQQYTAALEYAAMCMNIMQESGDTVRMTDILELQEECNFHMGDIATAYTLAKQAHKSKTEEMNAAAQHKVSTLLIQFDVVSMRREAEINRLKTEQLEKEVEMKHNELTALALHLVNKNEFLADLREQITDNIENTNAVVQAIAKRINNSEKDESDWQRFEHQFMQVNPGFSAKLMQQSTEALTPTEIKICQLIRTGLSSAEIANILFLSKRTVENHRYNIHKKLNLGAEKLNAALLKI
jgi:tetratricopeptide (TPR) repeat protein/DNA-binding CsgD family transcriptional regulator